MAGFVLWMALALVAFHLFKMCMFTCVIGFVVTNIFVSPLWFTLANFLSYSLPW